MLIRRGSGQQNEVGTHVGYYPALTGATARHLRQGEPGVAAERGELLRKHGYQRRPIHRDGR